MGSEINYKQIMDKIDKIKELSSDEKVIVKVAVDELFTKYAIGANGLVSMIKITADRKTLEGLKEIIGRAKERVKAGKPAMTPADKRELRKCLSYLKEESVIRISRSIEEGNYLFLSILHRELGRVDIEEMQKLQKIIENIK